jgi:hypothetical protein
LGRSKKQNAADQKSARDNFGINLAVWGILHRRDGTTDFVPFSLGPAEGSGVKIKKTSPYFYCFTVFCIFFAKKIYKKAIERAVERLPLRPLR